MSVAKRLKREYYAEKEEIERRAHQTQQALEDMDECQLEIDKISEKSSEEIVKVQERYNELRKPLFEERNRIIQKIPNFWITAFLNHPQIASLIDEDEMECLRQVIKLEVKEFDVKKCGYKIKFFFKENVYFENETLTKEIELGGNGPKSKSTPIKWKYGKNLINLVKERNFKKGKKMARTFFTWFEEASDPTNDDIAEAIKDDLWPNCLTYYLSSDSDVDTYGMEEEDEQKDRMEDEEYSYDDDADNVVEDLEDEEVTVDDPDYLAVEPVTVEVIADDSKDNIEEEPSPQPESDPVEAFTLTHSSPTKRPDLPGEGDQ